MLKHGPYALKPSPIFAFLYLLLFCSSFLVALVTLTALWQQLLVSIAILLYGCYGGWRQVNLRAAHAIKMLAWQEDGSWQVITNNAIYCATLGANTLLTHKVMILHFHAEQTKLTTIIFKDSLPFDDFRRLFVLLTCKQQST